MSKAATHRAYLEERRHIEGREVGYLPFPEYSVRELYDLITADQFVNLARLINKLRHDDADGVRRFLTNLCHELFFAAGGHQRVEVKFSTNWAHEATAYFAYTTSGVGHCIYLKVLLDQEKVRSAELQEKLDAARASMAGAQDNRIRVEAAQNLVADTQQSTIKAMEAKLVESAGQVRELQERLRSMEADAAQAHRKAACDDLAAERAKFEAAMAAASASLEHERAKGRELVLDINAMGEETDKVFAALQREEDRAIKAEERAEKAEAVVASLSEQVARHSEQLEEEVSRKRKREESEAAPRDPSIMRCAGCECAIEAKTRKGKTVLIESSFQCPSCVVRRSDTPGADEPGWFCEACTSEWKSPKRGWDKICVSCQGE